MEETEYKERLKKIEDDYNKEKINLHVEYGLSKSKFKKGDIIKDDRWILLIDNISVIKTFGFTEPVYQGLELKKDLTPRKDGNRVSIYGHHLVELVRNS